jgi:hypothetical protein
MSTCLSTYSSSCHHLYLLLLQHPPARLCSSQALRYCSTCRWTDHHMPPSYLSIRIVDCSHRNSTSLITSINLTKLGQGTKGLPESFSTVYMWFSLLKHLIVADLTNYFESCQLWDKDLDSIRLTDIDDLDMYGNVEARKNTPYLFVKSFLSRLQAVINGDRAKAITTALELLNKHPDLHNRNLHYWNGPGCRVHAWGAAAQLRVRGAMHS